jgi:hypothetical protein
MAWREAGATANHDSQIPKLAYRFEKYIVQVRAVVQLMCAHSLHTIRVTQVERLDLKVYPSREVRASINSSCQAFRSAQLPCLAEV